MKVTSFVLLALAGLALAQDAPDAPADAAVAPAGDAPPAGDATTSAAPAETTPAPAEGASSTAVSTSTTEATPASTESASTEKKPATPVDTAAAPKDGEPAAAGAPAGDATPSPTPTPSTEAKPETKPVVKAAAPVASPAASTPSTSASTKTTTPKGAYMILPATGTKDAYGPGETHIISVARNNQLTFEPASIRPRSGDVVRFQFLTGTHPIASCNWELPCQENGVWNSKAHPTKEENGIKYVDFFVVAATPLWFFSTDNNECQKGMTFAMNPNDDSQLASYIERSKKYQKKGKRDELVRSSAPRVRRSPGGLGQIWGL